MTRQYLAHLRIIRLSASLAAVAATLVSHDAAWAQQEQDRPEQDQAEKEAEEDENTIVVSGIRLANQRAVEAKRDSDKIIDVLAADDLNKLPDQNLAEALARVPGLTSFQDEGAGLYVGIRGLSQEFVNLTMDGLEVSVASRTFERNLRGANLEAVPSTFVSQVEVIKSVTPDLDGDAIAGTVNLVTRSAIDSKSDWFNIGASVGQYEEDVPFQDVDPSVKGNVSFGTTFANDMIGLVIDANIREIKRDNLKPFAYFGSQDDVRQIPDEVTGFFYERDESSWGGTAKLEIRPSDKLQAYVSATYFDSDTGQKKNKHAMFGANSDPDTMTFSDGVGTARNDDIVYGVDDSLSWTAAFDLFVDERNTISAIGRTSGSTSFQDDPRIDWFYGGPLSGDYTFNGKFYVHEFDAASLAAFTDPDNYVFNGYRRFQEEFDKDVDSFRFDWTSTPANDRGFGFAAGAKYKETAIDYRASFFRWRNPVDDFDFAQFLFVEDYNFPGGNSPQVVMSDIAALKVFAEGLGASSFGRVQGYTNGEDYKVSEEVLAAYALFNYASDDFRFVGGVRYEDTVTTANNRFDRIDDAAFVETKAGYGNWLPSAALTWFVSEDVLLRAGASRTIGRPDIRDLARGETPPNDNGFFERGNPDLKPRTSNNFDLSLEYYFDGGNSLLSAALFHKDISNEIFDLQTPYVFTNDLGVDVDAFFTQPDNGGSAYVRGIELGLVMDRFDFLPGLLANFGTSINVTFADGELDLLDDDGAVLRTVAPEGQSDFLANATLFYDDGRLSGRIAWQHTGAQTQGLSIDGSADLRIEDYEQTDLQIGYKITDNFEIFGEVWNLFENEQEFTNQNLVSGNPNWFEFVRYGRAVWVGVNFKR
ncbi:TonB-dependent receptor [Qipengyuania qiaonensis]|uniref:TonB-dependent receptor n=1 Tax=Qipengyuania qiaonensis TaxID=2867240 RepID=A0ABS7JBC1_9SPHN|nr:TonB-dependent receptor [Qipengyuania qiaonensis]MBX7483149.1 TonB-dependent receptor [Qipengyuania qiaonensis]